MIIDDFDELHYIAHIDNLVSILTSGILSHQGAARLQHESIESEEVQDRRRRVRIPMPDGSRPLHSFVNLYFSARNPMLFLRRGRHDELTVLRVRKNVLSLPGAVVSDCNASSDHARFGAGIGGLAIVDKDLVFAEYWTDPDPIVYYRRKSAKCAEVLIPDVVPPDFIFGVYVSTPESLNRIGQMCQLPAGFQALVDGHLFFL